HASRELKIVSALLGAIFAALGLGLLTGALAAARMATRYGQGPTMLRGTLTSAVAALLIPLAHGPLTAIVVILVFAQFLQAFGIQIIGACGLFIPFLLLLLSPMRNLRKAVNTVS